MSTAVNATAIISALASSIAGLKSIINSWVKDGLRSLKLPTLHKLYGIILESTSVTDA